MLKSIDHIGVAVRDIEEMTKFYQQNLGARLTSRVDMPELGYKMAFFCVGGVDIELVECSRDARGPVAQSIIDLIERFGGGVHHICFEVDDIQGALAILRARGIRLMSERAIEVGCKRIAWLHPISCGGAFLELCDQVKERG